MMIILNYEVKGCSKEIFLLSRRFVFGKAYFIVKRNKSNLTLTGMKAI